MRETNKTMIVFSPHPDDETCGCGGTIAKRVGEGYEVLIVVLTDGRHAFSKVLGIDSDPTPEELGKIRREEVRRAVRILGVREENLIFLDFEDGTIDQNSDKVEEKIIEILIKKPSLEVYIPYEKDCHPDHCATNRIVRNAIEKLDLSTMRFKYSIVRTYARVGPLLDVVLSFFRRNRICVDISKFLSPKIQAIKEFKSEVSIVSSGQKEPILKKFKKFLKNKETFFIDK